tara:strand:+ start:419 stop:529 length:111 start_codon:yes stop_codon:yes gene_type:complete
MLGYNVLLSPIISSFTNSHPPTSLASRKVLTASSAL